MARKNFAATGSFVAEDRPRALDLLGFSSQLVFNTFHNRRLRDWEHGGDARAGLRRGPGPQPGDGRVLLGRPPAAAHLLRAARSTSTWPRPWPTRPSTMGAAALLVASGCPPGHSPSHWGSTRCGPGPRRPASPWSSTSGGTGDLIDPAYFRNGLPVPPDFHGGEENFRSVDYMGIPGPPAQTLATMIFDGVLERFPDAAARGDRAGGHLGAVVDSADGGRLRGLRPPRGAAARPVPATHRVRPPPGALHPYPTEDVGWIIEQSGPEVCLFSSDYPHVEGGRRPLERFEASLAATDAGGVRALLHATTSWISWARRPRPWPPDPGDGSSAWTSPRFPAGSPRRRWRPSPSSARPRRGPWTPGWWRWCSVGCGAPWARAVPTRSAPGRVGRPGAGRSLRRTVRPRRGLDDLGRA